MPHKLLQSLKFQHYAVAEFKGYFPLDALRYDHCFPLHQADSLAIEQSFLTLTQPSPQRRYVLLTKFTDNKGNPWTIQFWKSQANLNLYELDALEDHLAECPLAIQTGTIRKWINDNVYHLAITRNLDPLYKETEHTRESHASETTQQTTLLRRPE